MARSYQESYNKAQSMSFSIRRNLMDAAFEIATKEEGYTLSEASRMTQSQHPQDRAIAQSWFNRAKEREEARSHPSMPTMKQPVNWNGYDSNTAQKHFEQEFSAREAGAQDNIKTLETLAQNIKDERRDDFESKKENLISKGVINKKLAGVGVAEKGHVDFEISVNAKGGHSSQPPKHTALGKLAKIICKLENNQFKEEITPMMSALFTEIGKNTTYPVRCVMCNVPILKPLIRKIMIQIPPAACMTRTTTAVTMASGSPAPNVLPQKATINVNLRIMPGQTIETVEKHLRKCAGEEAEINLVKGNNPSKTLDIPG